MTFRRDGPSCFSSRGSLRREWLILAGVLVPFSLLLVAGFLFTQGEPPSQPAPEPAAHAEGKRPAAAPPSNLTPPAAPVEGKRPAAAPPSNPTPPAAPALAGEPREETPPGLEAALAAVRPAVRQCFTDAAHHPPRATLRVTFRARSDGRFDGYRLEARAWQDPYFEACVEDAFDEVRWDPSGREPGGPVTHTFVLTAP
ncbi:MAG: hypothetical protein AB1938_25380 [Myxococcota bacterium]